MDPLPQPHESPAKGAAKERVDTGSMGRFKNLAKRLFGLGQSEFQVALEKDERERHAKRGR